ncbi:uncharacterized mitochondrial protein-like protein [Tanacetum coccineum]
MCVAQVAQHQVNPDSTIARVEQITSFRKSGTGGPATLEHVTSCIVEREAYCSTEFEGRVVGCKPNPTSFGMGRAVWHEPEQFSSKLNNISLDPVDCHDYLSRGYHELYTIQRSVQRCVQVRYTLTFNIKYLGNLNYYLGIELLKNKLGIIMTQRKYTLELIHTTDILDLKPSHIPIDPNIKLNDTGGDPLPDASPYRALVGKLLYLTITRPDLSYATYCLSQSSHSPKTPHFDALIKVLGYIKLCPGKGLHFPTHSILQLKAYCDSDWPVK